MLGRWERDEIRQFIYTEMVRIESDIAHHAGTYNYLCLVGGSPCFTHQPTGAVLRAIPHLPA